MLNAGMGLRMCDKHFSRTRIFVELMFHDIVSYLELVLSGSL